MALIRGFSPAQFRDAVIGSLGPYPVTATIPSTATGANGTVAAAVPASAGFQVGDILFVIPAGAALVAGVDVEAVVTSTTAISLVAHNGSGGAYNPGSATYTLVGFRFKTA